MFRVCRFVRVFISYLLVVCQILGSTAFAVEDFLSLALEKDDASFLFLKVSRHIPKNNGTFQEDLMGWYRLPFEEGSLYSSFQGNSLFQGVSSKRDCTLRFCYEQTDMDLVVDQKGKILVRHMVSPDLGIKIQSFGPIATQFGDVQSLSMAGSSLTQSGKMRVKEDFYFTGRHFKNTGQIQSGRNMNVQVTKNLMQQGKDSFLGATNFYFSCEALALGGMTSISDEIQGSISGNRLSYETPSQDESDPWKPGTLSAGKKVELTISPSSLIHPLVTEGSLQVKMREGSSGDLRFPPFMRIGGDLILQAPTCNLMIGQGDGASSRILVKGDVVLKGEKIEIQNGGIAGGENIELEAQDIKIGKTLLVDKNQPFKLPGGHAACFPFQEQCSNGSFVQSKKNLKVISNQCLIDMASLTSGQNLDLKTQKSLTIFSGSLKAGGSATLLSPEVLLGRQIVSYQGYHPSVEGWYVNASLPNSVAPELHAEGLLTFLNLEKGVCQSGRLTSGTGIQGQEKMSYQQMVKTISVDVPQTVIFYLAKYFSVNNFSAILYPALNRLKPDPYPAGLRNEEYLLFPDKTCHLCIEKTLGLFTPVQKQEFSQLLSQAQGCRQWGHYLAYGIPDRNLGLGSMPIITRLVGQERLQFERMAQGAPQRTQKIIEKCRPCLKKELQEKYEADVVKEALAKLPPSAATFFKTLDLRPTSSAGQNVHQKIRNFRNLGYIKDPFAPYFTPSNVLLNRYFSFMPSVVLNEMLPLNQMAAPQTIFDFPAILDLGHLLIQASHFKAHRFTDMKVGRFLAATSARYTPFHVRQNLIDYLRPSQMYVEAPHNPLGAITLPNVLRDEEVEKNLPTPVMISRDRLSQNPPYRRLYHPQLEMDAIQAALIENLNRPFLDFSGKQTREAVYTRLIQNAQRLCRALEGRGTLTDNDDFSSVSQTLSLDFDEPALFHYPIVKDGETVLAGALLYPPAWKEKSQGVRSLAGGIFAQMITLKQGQSLEILGELHAEKKGILDVKQTRLKGQVQYHSIPSSYYGMGHDSRNALIQSYMPTALTHYLAPSTQGMYVLLNQGKVTGAHWEFQGEDLIIEPGSLVKGEERVWFNTTHLLNQGRIESALAIVDSTHVQNITAQRQWTEFHEVVREKRSWWGGTKTQTTSVPVHRQESYPSDLSGCFDVGQFVGDARVDVSAHLPNRRTQNRPSIQSFENTGGTIRTGLGGLRLYPYFFGSFSQRDVLVVPYSTKSRGFWGSVQETGVIRQERARPSSVTSAGPMDIEFWKGVIEGGSLFQIIGLNPPGEITIVSHERVDFPGMILTLEEAPKLRRKGLAIQRTSGFYEVGLPAFFSAETVSFDLTGSTTGVHPQITQTSSSSRTSPCPPLTALQPTASFYNSLRHVQQMDIIDLVISPEEMQLATLATSFLTAHTAAPALMGSLSITHPVPTAALTAGLSTLAGQTTRSLLAHSGNVKKTLRDLGSSDFLRATALTMTTAGITQGLSDTLGFPSHPGTLTEHIQKNALRLGVRSIVERTPLNRTDVVDFMTSTVGGSLCNLLGSLYGTGEINPVTHKLLHGLLGGATGSLLSKDPTRGAVAGALGALVAEITAETLVPWEAAGEISPSDLAQKAAYARFIAGTVALATGQDMDVALQTAQTAVENNFVPMMLTAGKILWEVYATTHEEELDALKKSLAQWVAEKTDWDAETVEQTYDVLLMAGSTGNALRKGAKMVVKKLFLEDKKILSINAGRRGKQQQLRKLMDDEKVSSSDRGWLKQDLNAINRGKRERLRVPPNKELAHKRGFEAKKGYDYSYTVLQEKKLHKLQHKYDGKGKKNKTPKKNQD